MLGKTLTTAVLLAATLAAPEARAGGAFSATIVITRPPAVQVVHPGGHRHHWHKRAHQHRRIVRHHRPGKRHHLARHHHQRHRAAPARRHAHHHGRPRRY